MSYGISVKTDGSGKAIGFDFSQSNFNNNTFELYGIFEWNRVKFSKAEGVKNATTKTGTAIESLTCGTETQILNVFKKDVKK
ncbi:hypothetical protein [Pseudobacillus badius]|uniref:hypothetical protein n=1 Tax=Bacillus badius TaxID=1455 RepID=UPI0007B3EBCF|nr:hypothetical protein [Bacillus badius]KZR58871.1 hypothetical protein A3781_15125 [Bacillus badius]